MIFCLQIITDLSGNSFVENLCAPDNDPKIVITHYDRSGEEDRLLGIYQSEDTNESAANETKDDLKNEVLQFATNCPNCGAPVCTNMKVTGLSSNPQHKPRANSGFSQKFLTSRRL